jgi:hypothetical protein
MEFQCSQRPESLLQKWGRRRTSQKRTTAGYAAVAGLAVDITGDLDIIDAGGNQVLKLAAGAASTTPLLTGLNNLTNVAVDSAGNLHITESGSNRVLILPSD